MSAQAYALRLAERHLAAVAAAPLPIKYETLTFQRAAFAASGELPIYGSSELFCCGQPDLPTEFFARGPTGFQPFAVGRAGTGDLMFLETFGALGGALRGRRVVVSVSPQWFYGRAGITAGYSGNFSPEVAEVFTYDAPLPLALREAAARQMLAHPGTLAGQGLLRLGVRALAGGDLPFYYALLPAGRIDAWAQQVKDAWQTIAFIDTNGDSHGGGGGARPGAKVQRAASAPAGQGQVTLAADGIGPGAVAAVTEALRAAVGRIGAALLREAVVAPARPAVAAASSGAASAAAGSSGGGSSGAGSAAAGSPAVSAAAPSSASSPMGSPGRVPAAPSPAGRKSAASRAAFAGASRSGATSTAVPAVRRVTARVAIQPVGAPPSARPLLAALTRQAGTPAAGAPIDWRAKLAAATRLDNILAGSDPFGFHMNAPSLRLLEPALRLYCAGASNATGAVYPYPSRWAATMRGSAEWTDLGLELGALRDLGANALVWTVPFQGYYDNFTQLSPPARQVYYDRLLQVAAPSGFPAVTFASADGDRLFIANTGNHFSARGWVVADRVLDLFWHGRAAAIPGTIAAMIRAVPAPPPARPLACPKSSSGGIVHAGASAAG